MLPQDELVGAVGRVATGSGVCAGAVEVSARCPTGTGRVSPRLSGAAESASSPIISHATAPPAAASTAQISMPMWKPWVIAAGMLLMTRIGPGDSYVRSVLPAVIVFALGVTLVASPVTATALAAVDASHAGLASGINNAVSRVGNLLAVAVLPVAAGITGDRFYDPAAMTHGFRIGMVICAVLAVAVTGDATSVTPRANTITAGSSERT